MSSMLNLKRRKRAKKNKLKNRKIIINLYFFTLPMNLPTRQQCLGYFTEYKVPGNIFEHCLKVEEAASFLAKKLHEAGEDINVELVERLALLHDLFKVVVLDLTRPNPHFHYKYSSEETEMWKYLQEKYPDCYEGDVAYEIFKEDYPELAVSIKIVGLPKKKDKSYEEMLVHYADWRTLGNRVVPLSERLAYLKQTYPREAEDWHADEKIVFEFESRIMKVLNIPPEKLPQMIKNHPKLSKIADIQNS